MKKKITGLWDIHTHILYGVDDGSKNEKMSMDMLALAWEEGITDMILTPHYNPARWEFAPARHQEIIRHLEALCEERGIDIRFHLGCEMMWSSDCKDAMMRGEVQPMAGSDYMLVEFRPQTEFRVLRDAVQTIIQCGYNPIVAHVERYEAILSEPGRVEELRDLGALIQVNAGSIMGDFGKDTKKVARQLLKWEEVDFIATDAHRETGRAPYIQECAAYITKKFGESYAQRIFRDNPADVADNNQIEG